MCGGGGAGETADQIIRRRGREGKGWEGEVRRERWRGGRRWREEV